jgi:hypothetical protein
VIHTSLRGAEVVQFFVEGAPIVNNIIFIWLLVEKIVIGTHISVWTGHHIAANRPWIIEEVIIQVQGDPGLYGSLPFQEFIKVFLFFIFDWATRLL